MRFILPDKITLEKPAASVPVKIVRERRRSLRAAVGASGFIFRIPNSFNLAQFDEAWLWFSSWANQLVIRKPSLLSHLIPKLYQHGDSIKLMGIVYSIQLITTDTTSSRASLLPNNIIQIKLSNLIKGGDVLLAVPKLIAGLMAKTHLTPIKSRVAALNNQFFKVSIKDIKIVQTKSRWGSCSNTGIIRLSSRLLLAPPEVIDYVIIHELAHLVVFNHSSQFWKTVERAMPDYREKEKWLKENNYHCHY
jgi:predicted metal-dependent hydrolase